MLAAAVSLSDAPPTSVPFISDLTISGPLTAEPPTVAVLSAVNPLPGVEAQAAVSPLAVIASISVPPDLPFPAVVVKPCLEQSFGFEVVPKRWEGSVYVGGNSSSPSYVVLLYSLL